MNYFLSTPGVSVGTLGIPEIVVICVVFLAILIGFIAFRINYRQQMAVSAFLDVESGVYNDLGLRIYLKSHRGRFTKPTMLVVRLNNLDILYQTYPNKDVLMHSIASILTMMIGKNETIGKVEYNKFILAFNSISKDEIKKTCEDIEKELNDFEFKDYGKFNFLMDFGVYEGGNFKDHLDDDIMRCLFCIENSRSTEKNVYFYSDDVERAITRQKEINEKKQYALDNKLFVPYVQPKVDFKTGKVAGGEVLVRWVDDKGSIAYYPNEFIPLFEKNGFVKNVDILMFEYACNIVKNLMARGYKDIVISVNASKVLLCSQDFVSKVTEIVKNVGVDPQHIEVEVTETVVMTNYATISKVIAELHQQGFKIGMDDFGKEYSSLGELARNQFDTIKLDGVFFKDGLKTEKSKYIVRSLLNMLGGLYYDIVCECVEDQATLDILATIYRDVEIQGYVYAKPMPEAQYYDFVKNVFPMDYAPIVNYEQVASEATERAASATTELDSVKSELAQLRMAIQQGSQPGYAQPSYQQPQYQQPQQYGNPQYGANPYQNPGYGMPNQGYPQGGYPNQNYQQQQNPYGYAPNYNQGYGMPNQAMPNQAMPNPAPAEAISRPKAVKAENQRIVKKATKTFDDQPEEIAKASSVKPAEQATKANPEEVAAPATEEKPQVNETESVMKTETKKAKAPAAKKAKEEQPVEQNEEKPEEVAADATKENPQVEVNAEKEPNDQADTQNTDTNA